jgi:hypothetical protein
MILLASRETVHGVKEPHTVRPGRTWNTDWQRRIKYSQAMISVITTFVVHEYEMRGESHSDAFPNVRVTFPVPDMSFTFFFWRDWSYNYVRTVEAKMYLKMVNKRPLLQMIYQFLGSALTKKTNSRNLYYITYNCTSCLGWYTTTNGSKLKMLRGAAHRACILMRLI